MSYSYIASRNLEPDEITTVQTCMHMSVSLEIRRVLYACPRMEHAHSVSSIFKSIIVLLLCILEVSGSKTKVFGGSTSQSNALLFLRFFFWR